MTGGPTDKLKVGHGFDYCRISRQVNQYSCIKFYKHSCLKLCLNGQEVVFKQQNPCSNHEIHMLFEHGFDLLKSQEGPCFVHVAALNVAL